MAFTYRQFPEKPVSDYTTIRDTLRSGDLLLCSGSGWFSKMIQRATGSTWSHVGFIMRLDAIDRIMLLESLEPIGVRAVPLSKYLEDYNSKGEPYPGGLVIARHEQFQSIANAEKLNRFGQFAVDLFGYPYDKNEIAKIAARISAGALPFNRQEKKALQPDREYICSEYVWQCYRELGIEIEHDSRGFIAPADFAKDEKINLQYVLRPR